MSDSSFWEASYGSGVPVWTPNQHLRAALRSRLHRSEREHFMGEALSCFLGVLLGCLHVGQCVQVASIDPVQAEDQIYIKSGNLGKVLAVTYGDSSY